MKRQFWKDKSQDPSYRLVQWCLDMCDWNPTHYRRVLVNDRVFNLPVGGRIPSCRDVVGPDASDGGLVSFAIAQDCAKPDCTKCAPPKHLRLLGATPDTSFLTYRK